MATYRYRSSKQFTNGEIHHIVVEGHVTFEDAHRVECEVTKEISNSHPASGSVTKFGFLKQFAARIGVELVSQ